MGNWNWVHLKALIRTNWLKMKADRKKSIAELVFTIVYGVLLGYEVSLSFSNSDYNGLSYVVFILLTPAAFQQSCIFIFNEMVRDRETRMKESLKIMGLNHWMYALSYMVQRGIWTTMTVLIMTLVSWLINTQYIDFGMAVQLFFAIWLLAFDTLALSLLLQNFFSDSKLASMIAPFILFLPTGLAMLAIIQPVVQLQSNNWVQYLYWMPTFPFEVVLTSIFQPNQVDFFFQVSVAWSWAALVLLSPIYFFLHIYFEAIVPDAYGVTESCCFCLRRSNRHADPSPEEDYDFTTLDQNQHGSSFSSNRSIQKDEENGEILDETKQQLLQPFELGGARKQNVPKHRQSESRRAFNAGDPIQLKHMTKEFGQFRAVDQMTLSIKQNEIIALLGHNGAGKTTAIYMLTGMLMPTHGDAIIHGNSIKTQTELVRRQIGLCQQHDVLYDLISVEEHLRMTLRIRLGTEDVAEEDRKIAAILREVMLTEHKLKLVRELSGGMKRKLSLGMALIGETKTIILDEPTSGLDVESRQQVWELIKALKQGRSIIMSTQHIEEADELADRVCIMSHGKIIALGTPQNIKRRFGVGYNVFVEPRSSANLSLPQLTEKLSAVDRVFLNRDDFDGIVKSRDSTDKNSLFLVPINLVDRISTLIQEIEQNLPEMQVDIELNSLEDAFIKIAEKDIEEEAQQNKALAQAQEFMTPEEEAAAFEDYKEFTGQQSFWQKVGVIFINRLKVFSRSGFQWYVLAIPMLYVIIQLFIAYALIVSIVPGDNDVDGIVQIFFTFYFTIFLVLGQSFTAGLYGRTPMDEKANGLRQMMHMSGISSFEYYLGLFLGDMTLFSLPAIVTSLALLPVPQIMVQEQVGMFFISYMFYGMALVNMVYGFCHIFSDPETATKYMGLIFFLVLLLIPIAISLAFAAIFGFDSSISSALSVWYWVNPQICFILQLYTLCCYEKSSLDEFSFKLFGEIESTTSLYIGIISIQIVIAAAANILVDMRIRNSHKNRGGAEGAPPPLLDVHQDVLDHEADVRKQAHLSQDDEDSLQIKAMQICKTYPGSERMAVCKNTFGAKKGEVYGLLGPNGAGKSTTFSMIAMQLPITSGSAELMGHDVTNFPLNEKGKFFGMCNQENLLWESLTVDESMNFIASLKGINGPRRERVKRLIMETLELNFFKNTVSKNLSGGNKRKLCCAQALMLCPRVLFLDEPTSGVDPVSRRSLNRMVKKMNMASVLLTTHRMDEAEQLCDRLAIMINGRFVVFGSPNYLKTQYGHGYTIEIIQERNDYENPSTNARKLMEEEIPAAQLVHDSSQDNQEEQQQLGAATPNDLGIDDPTPTAKTVKLPIELRYRIEGINIEGSQVMLSDTFAKLAQMLESRAIRDFSLMRTNLEQVFINFAKFQISGAAEGIPAVDAANE